MIVAFANQYHYKHGYGKFNILKNSTVTAHSYSTLKVVNQMVNSISDSANRCICSDMNNKNNSIS